MLVSYRSAHLTHPLRDRSTQDIRFCFNRSVASQPKAHPVLIVWVVAREPGYLTTTCPKRIRNVSRQCYNQPWYRLRLTDLFQREPSLMLSGHAMQLSSTIATHMRGSSHVHNPPAHQRREHAAAAGYTVTSHATGDARMCAATAAVSRGGSAHESKMVPQAARTCHLLLARTTHVKTRRPQRSVRTCWSASTP